MGTIWARASSNAREGEDRSRHSARLSWIWDPMGPIPYATLNGMIDPAFPKGALEGGRACERSRRSMTL
jgi:hypothetical protein